MKKLENNFSYYGLEWYGIVSTNGKRLPKYLLKGIFKGIGVAHYGNVMLTFSKENVETIKANIAKHNYNVKSFTITDRQFGLIDMRHDNKEPQLHQAFKTGITFKTKDFKGIIPVTSKQLSNEWL